MDRRQQAARMLLLLLYAASAFTAGCRSASGSGDASPDAGRTDGIEQGLADTRAERRSSDAANQPDAGSSESGAPDAGSDLVDPATRHGAFVWQGYDHEWLRSVAGFRVPHRISRFDSFIADEKHATVGVSWSATARFHFGQGTGVDGNYMKPRGLYRALYAPGLFVDRGELRVQWTDQVTGIPPQAHSSRKEMIVVDLDRASLSFGNLGAYTVLLRGLALQSRCDPVKQPPGLTCNSDGMWPYRLFFEIGACARQGKKLSCPLGVELHRAWTPRRGGVPGIAEKPLESRLDFDLRLLFTVLGADAAAAHFEALPLVAGSGYGHDVSPFARSKGAAGASGGAYPQAVIGLRAFGFTLSAPSKNLVGGDHLGRYIGAWRFSARASGYDAQSGAVNVSYSAQVWLPATVVQSKIDYQLRAELVQLGPGAIVAKQSEAAGSICQNSASNAPIFSVWKKCGEPNKGPERREHAVDLAAP